MRHGFVKVASASPSLKVGNPDFNKERFDEKGRERGSKGPGFS